MHNITLIFTHHSPIGRYSAHALCRVIHSVNPDVIFEELSEKDHTFVYKVRASVGAESDAIKMYLNHKAIDIVPVDTDEECERYLKHHDEMYKGIANLGDSEENTQRNVIIDNHRKLISQQGLSFVNSEESELMWKQEQDLLHDIIEMSNDARLKQIKSEYNEINDKREYIIINNIYRYSQSNNYERAIMFIGCGHRTTIIKVIEQFEERESLKLDWWLY